MHHRNVGKRLRTASIIIALMMEAASTSETPVSFYHITRRNDPPYTSRHENLKSLKNFQLLRKLTIRACSAHPILFVMV